MWQIVHGMEPDQVYFCTCLLQDFSFGTFFHGLTRFEETAGQIPQAATRFDGPLGNENTVLPHGNTAHDHSWILVMDQPAMTTNETGQMIAFWDFEVQLGRSAFRAEIHCGFVYISNVGQYPKCPLHSVVSMPNALKKALA